MDESKETKTHRQQQTEARIELRQMGVEIDASDHREPTEIVSALAALGIHRSATTPNGEPSLAKRRSVSPYLAF